LDEKRVLVVVSRKYNGHEFWVALWRLQEVGVKYDVIASDNLIIDEITGEVVRLQVTFDDVLPGDMIAYNGLMFIFGDMPLTEIHWHHPLTQGLVAEAHRLDLPIAAICCSVPSIRRAANGKRVSAFPLVRARILLEDAGAILTHVAVTVDGKLVTAEHQMATQEWATLFVDVVLGKPASANYTPTTKSYAKEILTYRSRKLPPYIQRLIKEEKKSNPVE